MPKHQQRAARTPYSRPQPTAQNGGLFSRIKNFFWGEPKPTELGPPRVISNESHASSDSDTEEASRITHTSVDAESSTLPALDAHYSTIRQTSNNSLSSVNPDGPNEALRRFFEEKGDGDLSNMEVVGVLSLISQAVSRNESLVDFSNLTNSETYNTTAGMNQTPSSTSILRDLHAPPSPRPYLSGTPPSIHQVRSRSSLANGSGNSRSTWTSPRPSRISARHSIGYGRPTPRQQLQSSVRKLPIQHRTSSRYQPAQQPAQQQSTAFPSRHRAEDMTPAASAILKALDGDEPAKTQQHHSLKKGQQLTSTSTPFKDNKEQAEATIKLPSLLLSRDVKNSPASLNAGGISSTPKKFEFNSSKDKRSTASEDSSEMSTTTITKPDIVPTSIHFSKPQADTTQGDGPESSSQISEEFEFEIPVSKTPREMTPAEAVVVAESQAEFTF